jgi:hypothetical protein
MLNEHNRIAITLDLEWAPDSVLKDTFDLLDSYGIECTAFSTHDDAIVARNHERGLHPNFEKEMSDEAILSTSQSILS